MNFSVDLLRTTAFRLTLLYVGLFGISNVVLLGFIYWTTTRYMDQQTDMAIAAEADALRDVYRQGGLDELRRSIDRRSAAGDETERVYLLASSGRTQLAGNMKIRTGASPSVTGWSRIALSANGDHHDDEEEAQRARILTTALPGGYYLVVGRDLHEREELRRYTLLTLLWALGITLTLGLLGGLVMSRNVLHRIDGINRTSRAIMAGHLARRIPLTGGGDEFDELAGNLNRMLDKIERLMDATRLVTDSIAHDLRSPLNRLRSRLELAQLSERPVEEYRSVMEQSLAEVDGLLDTFNALLGIAHAEAGGRRNDWERVDLSAIVRDIAELYQPLAEDRNHTLSSRIQEDLSLYGSRQLLAQALSNLLDNAIKYTPPGGLIEITAARYNNKLEISVADNGPGIPEGLRQQALERFVRLDTSRSTSGSGLGLSLVRAVAQLHHAELELTDNHPGLKVIMRFSEEFVSPD
jgi:signal transduction histidine kinase